MLFAQFQRNLVQIVHQRFAAVPAKIYQPSVCEQTLSVSPVIVHYAEVSVLRQKTHHGKKTFLVFRHAVGHLEDCLGFSLGKNLNHVNVQSVSLGYDCEE